MYLYVIYLSFSEINLRVLEVAFERSFAGSYPFSLKLDAVVGFRDVFRVSQ